MAERFQALRDHIVESGYVLDPEGVHYEFVGGMHGRKLDFDSIPDGSELYEEWVEANIQKLRKLYPWEVRHKLGLVGVANGANRLAVSVADRLSEGVFSVKTKKVSAKAVELTDEGAADLLCHLPGLVVVMEDVGTTGTTSATAVEAIRDLKLANRPNVEVLNTWQRCPKLERLVGIHAVYNSIIYEPLPTLNPEECRESGYCAQGWELIEHAK